MISDGSCDTEHWSNDAENTALPLGINYYILKYIKIENRLYFIILLFLWDVFQKHKKNIANLKLLNSNVFWHFIGIWFVWNNHWILSLFHLTGQ